MPKQKNMSKILLLSDDIVSSAVAGPGMRYVELARALSKKHKVWLVVKPGAEINNEGFHVLNLPVFIEFNFGIKVKIPNPALKRELKKYDLIINQGWTLLAFGLPRTRGKIIMDLYCPWFLENLEAARLNRVRYNSNQLPSLKKMIKYGDFFICANEKQKDLYLGLILGTKKINPSIYYKDPTLSSLIGMVPTGISSTSPNHTKKVLKGMIPGISQSDKVILWWGGIWDWLDPETAIKAMAQAVKTRKDLRLVFFGIKHPHHPLHNLAQRSIQLARELDLYDKSVFFIQQWIPYEERANYLLESDLGIITHQDTLETRFSWRTRVLDYFWAGLPVVSTEGDSMADLIRFNRLGKTVPPSSPEKLAQTLLEILENSDEYRKIKDNIEKFKPSLYWEKVIGPIERFIEVA